MTHRLLTGYRALVQGALVGRDVERSTLWGWLDEALAGTGLVGLVSGDAGAGKSALLEDLLGHAVSRDVAVATGPASEQEGAPPFWPWRSVLRVLGGPDLLAGAEVLDRAAERFVRFEEVASWLAGVAGERGGLVVAFDDLHRADRSSMRLFAHVAAGLRGHRILLVGTHRPSAADHAEGFATLLADVARQPARRALDVGGLGRAAVAQLLGAEPASPLADRVWELTRGNALFVSELSRHLAAGRAIADLPDTLREVIGVRLAARSAGCLDVLRTAAVVGRDFSAGVVATAQGRPATQVLEHLDEAVAAAVVAPAGAPGRFQFVHALVRDAVEAGMARPDLARLHRRVAEAVERYYGAGDDQLSDLARHWDEASVLGAGEVAAGWSERAAGAAEGHLAWEEAARLYERAVALGGPGADPVDRHRRLVGAARSRLHSDEFGSTVARCIDAGRAAREAGRGDLLADAALVVEGRGGSGGPEIPALVALVEEALVAVDTGDHGRRARLFGLLAVLCFYTGSRRCSALSDAAMEEADRAGDPLATAAAARARQMLRFGPEHAPERLLLAERIGEAGRAAGDPSISQWEPLWRIDALLELGRIPEAVATLPLLRQQATAVGHPMSRWHLARSEAVLAAATGRWADAQRFGVVAQELYAMQEGHEGAVALELALRVSIGIHTGFDPAVLADYDRVDVTRAPAYVSDIPTLLPLLPLVALGRHDEAHSLYSRSLPVAQWEPPAFLWLPIHVYRLLAALALGRLDDVPPLLERLRASRGFHVAGGGGPIAYLGCIELHLGEGAMALGRWDEAAGELRHAVAEGKRAATAPFEVRAGALLAEALARRGRGDDGAGAAQLASRYRPAAEALGMAPWAERLGRLAGAGAPPPRAGPLSARELEVAGLVARGLSNKAIAAQLHISARTAQNHVQHILTKLGVANRTQVASWFGGDRR
jgi:DNA-binding CsgD family transcriptional regulator/Arc/MetJ family transcription regulator